MFRVLSIVALALGLVSCGEQGPSIEGKWAWFDVASCEGDINTIEFSGSQFTRRFQGEVGRVGRDLAYRQTDEDGSPRITAIYLWVNDSVSRTVTITFEQQGTDVLIYRGSTIDGQVPASAASTMGRELYRCP